ncbi:MAG: helix-turn-helix domain-containing protein [Gammaproteobacteria bacterium]|nr:helix-turn-helix domain-containing protein [Gammaproteobacteria bacterium]
MLANGPQFPRLGSEGLDPAHGSEKHGNDEWRLDPPLRVYTELSRMADPDAAVPGLCIIRPYPLEREFASRVCTTRETVARAVREFRNAGLVRRKERNLFILGRAKLKEIEQSYGVDTGS